MAIGVVTDAEFEAEISNIPNNKGLGNKKDSAHLPGPEDNNGNNLPSSSESVLEGEIVNSPLKGRGLGSLAVPESLQKLIAGESVSGGRKAALDLAKMYGVSSSAVSAYSNGAASTSSYDTPKEGISKVIRTTKERISKRAQGKLSLALSKINDDLFAEAKLRDVTGAARDMAAIVAAMEPPSNVNAVTNNGPQFILYSPPLRTESQFESISITE